MALTDSIATAAQAAATQLATDLKAAGVADTAALSAFVATYGPMAAQWGLDVVSAKVAGTDTARYTQDLADIVALAAGAAADAGITAESTAETDIAGFLKTALQSAVTAAVGSLVAL